MKGDTRAQIGILRVSDGHGHRCPPHLPYSNDGRRRGAAIFSRDPIQAIGRPRGGEMGWSDVLVGRTHRILGKRRFLQPRDKDRLLDEHRRGASPLRRPRELLGVARVART